MAEGEGERGGNAASNILWAAPKTRRGVFDPNNRRAEMNKAGLGARQLLLPKHPRFGSEKARLVCVLHTHKTAGSKLRERVQATRCW